VCAHPGGKLTGVSSARSLARPIRIDLTLRPPAKVLGFELCSALGMCAERVIAAMPQRVVASVMQGTQFSEQLIIVELACGNSSHRRLLTRNGSAMIMKDSRAPDPNNLS
jgi:hypothetical protein